jgi:hypothetical protein
MKIKKEPAKMKFKDRTFRKEDVHMDFNQFLNCTFIDCNLIYHGYGPIGMEGCSFKNVRWSFSDAAANTVAFMAALYAGAGEGGRQLIDKTFENIKAGQPFKK